MKNYYEFINEENEIKAGKHIFNSFLRIITSLGLNDIKPNWDSIPDDFLLFFEYISPYQSVYTNFERFPSLAIFRDKIPKDNCKLYYGIKNDMTFSFGFLNGDKLVEIGGFKMNAAAIRYLLLLESKSAAHLKRELAYLNVDNLKLSCVVSKYIKDFHPGTTRKRTFKINDGILEFGYDGLGTWDNNEVKNFIDIKKLFQDYLIKFKYRDKILFSIKCDTDNGNYIYLSIKIK